MPRGVYENGLKKFFSSPITFIRSSLASGFAFSHLHAQGLCVPGDFVFFELFANVSSSVIIAKTSLVLEGSLGTSPTRTFARGWFDA